MTASPMAAASAVGGGSSDLGDALTECGRRSAMRARHRQPESAIGWHVVLRANDEGPVAVQIAKVAIHPLLDALSRGWVSEIAERLDNVDGFAIGGGAQFDEQLGLVAEVVVEVRAGDDASSVMSRIVTPEKPLRANAIRAASSIA